MAGNAGLLKHASNVPGCALAIEEVFREAGFPDGLFRTLLIPGSRVAKVIENPLVRAVTLTGSTPAGKAVAAKAGEELFGPVASVIPVKDEEEALRVANDSCFGLGAAVFTKDVGRGTRIAREELEAGACFVNIKTVWVA